MSIICAASSANRAKSHDRRDGQMMGRRRDDVVSFMVLVLGQTLVAPVLVLVLALVPQQLRTTCFRADSLAEKYETKQGRAASDGSIHT
jgi:hypothetical protein